MKPTGALWRFLVACLFALAVFIVLVNVLRQPVTNETRNYTAEFTDAAGLHLDADVRVRGVRVGKVKSVALERRAGQSLAAVEFSLDRRYVVVPETRIAVKYQALTGLRYVDVVEPSETAPAASTLTRIPVSMTQPSFDITTLFNGLQPVLATLSPDDIDTFTENAATYLAGDGGLGPMLDSIRKLTEFVSNRQEVVATLMSNLNAVAETFGGHSKDFVQILDWLNRPLDATLTVLDEFRKSQLYGPGFTEAVVRLLKNVGFEPGGDYMNTGYVPTTRGPHGDVNIPPSIGNMDAGLDRAFTVFDDYTDFAKRVPVFWDNIAAPTPPGEPVPCSQGRAQLPGAMDVLLNGQRVILCNR